MTQNSGGGYPGSGYPASGYPASGYPSSGYPGSGYPASGYPARPSESLAQLVQDAANQFENVAQVLGQQYDTLDNATSGLLSGTFPWTGLGSDSFASAWENFGSYIQQLQQACQNTHDTLSKLSNRISDVEGQQGWNILLTIIGGVATIISFAAMIAELGLDPLVDGFFGIVAKFTEQEGADVANVAEEITQADSEAASELEQIEADLTASPTINGSVGNTGEPGGISPVNLEAMTAPDDLINADLQETGNIQPLENAGNAQIDPNKFEKYSMDPNNPNNRGKWKAFADLGYDVDTLEGRSEGTQDVISQLESQLPKDPATFERETPFGTRYEVRTKITGPNGKQGVLVTVWQYDTGSSAPRLITDWLETIK